MTKSKSKLKFHSIYQGFNKLEGDTKQLEELLKLGVDNIYTYCIECYQNHHFGKIKYLIDHGLNLNDMPYHLPERLLMLSVYDNRLDFIKYLVEKGKLSLKERDYQELFVIAITEKKLNIAKYLVQKGVNYNGGIACRVLEQVALLGDLEAVKYLIDELKIDLKLYGFGALYRATLGKHSNVIKYLEGKGLALI